MVEKVRGDLEEAGFSPDQMRMARGVIMRMAFAMKTQGDNYQINPRMQTFLEEKSDLDEEQIALLQNIAQRVAKRMPDGGQRGAHGRGDKMRNRFEMMRKKMESAVENGEMTREEADEKYREMRERMKRRRDKNMETKIENRAAENIDQPANDASTVNSKTPAADVSEVEGSEKLEETTKTTATGESQGRTEAREPAVVESS